MVQEGEEAKRLQAFNEYNDALDFCFRELLKFIADIDLTGHSGFTNHPCSFVVYAHENKDAGEANSQYVQEVIEWLKEIRAPNISDNSPLLLGESENNTNPAVSDILSSQMRLLPACDGSDKAEKVILCVSQVLRNYCEELFAVGYITQIRKMYEAEKQNIQKFETETRKFVTRQLKANGFHHVLTEIAFLQIRYDHYNGDNGIIAITLDGNDLGLEFLTDLSVYLKLPRNPRLVDRHALFFKILQRLYPSQHRNFDLCHTHYKNLSRQCEEDRNRVSLGVKVRKEIHQLSDNLGKLLAGGFRDNVRKVYTQNIANEQSRRQQDTTATESEAKRILSGLGYDGPLTTTKDFEAATRWAVKKKSTQGVQLLIDLGADISTMSPLPEPVLFQAIRSNDLSMTKLLTDHGADVHNSVKGNTPLQLAAANNAQDVIVFLEHKGAKWDVEGRVWQVFGKIGGLLR